MWRRKVTLATPEKSVLLVQPVAEGAAKRILPPLLKEGRSAGPAFF